MNLCFPNLHVIIEKIIKEVQTIHVMQLICIVDM